MDPTSIWSKMDALTKSLIAMLIALTLCAGFLFGKIGADWFASIATFVLGAIFGRTMGSVPTAVTKTIETDPSTGAKRETSISAPLGIPPTPPPPVVPSPPTQETKT